MFDSIFIGMSGLQGFSKGLKVISNNVANLNTPGFKSADLRFTDAFYQQANQGSGYSLGQNTVQYGTGLSTMATHVNFHQGETRQTGNALDVAIAGEGFLVVQDPETGTQRYTKSGQLQFDKNGDLVTPNGNQYVLGFAPNSTSGSLTRITLNGLRTNPAHATTTVKFTGNLSNTSNEVNLDSVKLIDALGGEHVVRLNFQNKNSTTPGLWTVTVYDGSTSVATGDIKFVNGMPDVANSALNFTYTPSGGSPMGVKLDFSNDVTSFSGGNPLAFASQDGYASGAITAMAFDANGALSLTYSNGQKAKGGQLALATFESNLGLSQTGGADFTADGTQTARLGRPGDKGFGSIQSGQLELSNVDLSSEFSDLIIMQRGYQASSRIVSTANEMLQELFDMKGHR